MFLTHRDGFLKLHPVLSRTSVEMQRFRVFLSCLTPDHHSSGWKHGKSGEKPLCQSCVVCCQVLQCDFTSILKLHINWTCQWAVCFCFSFVFQYLYTFTMNVLPMLSNSQSKNLAKWEKVFITFCLPVWIVGFKFVLQIFMSDTGIISEWKHNDPNSNTQLPDQRGFVWLAFEQFLQRNCTFEQEPHNSQLHCLTSETVPPLETCVSGVGTAVRDTATGRGRGSVWVAEDAAGGWHKGSVWVPEVSISFQK